MAIKIHGTGLLEGVTSGLTTSSLPAGSILQVQQSVKTDFWHRSELTYADIDGTDQNGNGTIWCVKITPSSSSSKIWVKGVVAVGGSGHGSVNLYRDSTEIHRGDAHATYGNVNRTTAQYLTGSHNCTNIALDFLDSPNTTNEVTYKMQGGNPHSASYNIYINRSHTQENHAYVSHSASTLTVLEVKG